MNNASVVRSDAFVRSISDENTQSFRGSIRARRMRVNTTATKFPKEFRSRENLGDLRGMHLRRYVEET